MIRWQNDAAFVAWLLSQEYIREENSKIHCCMSGGIYLYMYEAWRATQHSVPEDTFLYI